MVIVKGWPTPSENPVKNTITPKINGLGANAIAAQPTIEMRLVEISSCLVVKRRLKNPKKNRDAIDVAARIEMMIPIESAEN